MRSGSPLGGRGVRAVTVGSADFGSFSRTARAEGPIFVSSLLSQS